jgi:hypothetical protein
MNYSELLIQCKRKHLHLYTKSERIVPDKPQDLERKSEAMATVRTYAINMILDSCLHVHYGLFLQLYVKYTY